MMSLLIYIHEYATEVASDSNLICIPILILSITRDAHLLGGLRIRIGIKFDLNQDSKVDSDTDSDS